MDNLPSESVDAVAPPLQPPSGGRRRILHLFDCAPSARDTLLAVGTAFVFLLFYSLTMLLNTGAFNVIIATTFLSLVMMLLFNVAVSRAITSPRALAINTAVSATLALPLILPPVLMALAPNWHGWARVVPPLVVYLKAVRTVPGADGLIMIWLASCVGILVSRLIGEMKLLLPVAVVLALVDLYVVFGGGLVTQAQTGHAPLAQHAMQALTVKLPTTHPNHGAAPMQLAVGFADFMFIALFFAAFARYQVPCRKTFFVLVGVLVAYMFVVALKSFDLPALVPIAAVVIGVNFKAFRYERSEAFAMLYAAIIVVALVGGFVLLKHHG
jgi:hypothetical protein